MDRLEKVVYRYICRGCGKDIQTPIQNFDKMNQCVWCGNSYSVPLTYFNEKLTRPIQLVMRR